MATTADRCQRRAERRAADGSAAAAAAAAPATVGMALKAAAACIAAAAHQSIVRFASFGWERELRHINARGRPNELGFAARKTS